jgi:deoxyadenosine/deoxycytidine kinase
LEGHEKIEITYNAKTKDKFDHTTMTPKIFSVEGNIGAGKTTIIENLQKLFAENPDVIFIREPVDVWQTIVDKNGETILAKFYADPAKYAFTFQVMAYSTRLSMLRKIIRENPNCKTIICERSLDADKNIFAKMLYDDGLIDEVSHQIYKRFYGEFIDEFPLEGVVYIDADAEVCRQRITKRAREGEETVALDYLKKCQSYHEEWLNRNTATQVLHIKTNDDVTYDPNDKKDKGNIWMRQISDFINGVKPLTLPDNLTICERVLNTLEQFYNPSLHDGSN